MSGFNKLKKLPQLDMNPMVDMAFLLVSFFMMTTTFKTDAPIELTLPNSHADLKIPEKDIAVITIGKTGRFYFGIDSQFDRQKMLQFVAEHSDIQLNENQIKHFSLQSTFGVPLDQLGAFLELEAEERKAFEQNGIVVDSTKNELKQWILGARLANPQLRFAINADESVAYPYIHQCIETLRELNINRFSLITESPIDASES